MNTFSACILAERYLRSHSSAATARKELGASSLNFFSPSCGTADRRMILCVTRRQVCCHAESLPTLPVDSATILGCDLAATLGTGSSFSTLLCTVVPASMPVQIAMDCGTAGGPRGPFFALGDRSSRRLPDGAAGCLMPASDVAGRPVRELWDNFASVLLKPTRPLPARAERLPWEGSWSKVELDGRAGSCAVIGLCEAGTEIEETFRVLRCEGVRGEFGLLGWANAVTPNTLASSHSIGGPTRVTHK
mmetsp:Transcript_8993/g.23514  ORF Transcript_8993/g.23514 Transcript_8993/m.23514 type:complete len:248 (-) Transcript_8993:17-760(-)